MVMLSHTELSKGKLQVCRQNEVATEKIENDYEEVLNPYVNLRPLQQQSMASNDYIDDEHIYETINESLGDINYNKCGNEEEGYYMLNHTEISKRKLQACRQNEVTTEKTENDYV